MFEYNGSYEKLKNACWSDLWLHGTWYYIYRTQFIASVEKRPLYVAMEVVHRPAGSREQPGTSTW